jgi:hypothetical protein
MLAAVPLSLMALLAACGAPGGGEDAANAEQAYTPMPEGVCTLVAGSDPAHISGNAWPSSHAIYGGSDANVLAFEQDVGSQGASGTWWVSGYGTNAWLAIDASTVAPGTDEALANAWANVAPVNAGYFTCTWLWGDFPLPHGAKRPYVPTRILAFDPNCTKMHCAI